MSKRTVFFKVTADFGELNNQQTADLLTDLLTRPPAAVNWLESVVAFYPTEEKVYPGERIPISTKDQAFKNVPQT